MTRKWRLRCAWNTSSDRNIQRASEGVNREVIETEKRRKREWIEKMTGRRFPEIWAVGKWERKKERRARNESEERWEPTCPFLYQKLIIRSTMCPTDGLFRHFNSNFWPPGAEKSPGNTQQMLPYVSLHFYRNVFSSKHTFQTTLQRGHTFRSFKLLVDPTFFHFQPLKI